MIIRLLLTLLRHCAATFHISMRSCALYLLAVLLVVAPAVLANAFTSSNKHNPLHAPKFRSKSSDMEFTREAIICPTAPPAIGPYSHAVRAGGMLYVSGCIGVNPETKTLVPGGVGPQARMVMENLKNIIEFSGSNMGKVVKCTILLADMASFAEVNAIYGEYFPADPPARATFAVLGLPAGALVEIEAIVIA